LDEALSAELIPPHMKVASPNNADQRKQCRYHQNSWHSTEEYQTLKDKIEELIQVGHLRRFVKRVEIRGTPLVEMSSPREDSHLREPAATETAGKTASPEKAIVHEEMIFLGTPTEGATERILMLELFAQTRGRVNCLSKIFTNIE